MANGVRFPGKANSETDEVYVGRREGVCGWLRTDHLGCAPGMDGARGSISAWRKTGIRTWLRAKRT